MDSGPTRRSAIFRLAYQQMLVRLRKARVDAGLSQEEAARALKRPQSYVSKCELGERRIDPIDLMDFAVLYGRPVTYFLPRKTRQRLR